MPPETKAEQSSGARLRVGLLATDPLRMLGLETIFAEDGKLELVPLTVPGNLDLQGFALIVIDSGCTEHLFELLAGFRRKYPKLKVIVLGMDGEHSYIQSVIGAGAKGYLTHLARESEIRMAIDIVLDGSVWAPRKVLAKLLEGKDSASAAGSGEAPKITARELEVLHLLVAGRPNREIAESLGIDEGTVKAHVGRMMRKVGVENRIALTMQAMERKLLPDAN
ncbi:MAG: two component transcriptional regulator, LuxR family [Acidobacteriaceae bacterium]|nr:two component transcriptional regulator, LuxR family [Acidobacteriaceae bacterium]